MRSKKQKIDSGQGQLSWPSLPAGRQARMTVKQGMTLIETMVAIALTAVVTGSLVNIGLLSVANSTSATRRSLAIKYAEEGLEIVRSYRDSFGFDSLYSLYGGDGTSGGCYGVYSGPAIFLTAIACGNNDGRGAALVGTPFSRKVTIKKDPDGVQVLTTSIVFWSEKGRETNVSLASLLSKW